MAYDVTFESPVRELGKSDVTFVVKEDGEKIGTLKISKGSLVWFNKSTTYGHKISWKKFNKLVENNTNWFEKR